MARRRSAPQGRGGQRRKSCQPNNRPGRAELLGYWQGSNGKSAGFVPELASRSLLAGLLAGAKAVCGLLCGFWRAWVGWAGGLGRLGRLTGMGCGITEIGGAGVGIVARRAPLVMGMSASVARGVSL